MTYAEFLKSQGASDDDIKVLDVPVARKAWEKQQADSLALAADRDKFKADKENYDKWYTEEAIPATQRAQQERDAARAEVAASNARLKALQEAGLVAIAEGAEAGSTTPKPGETPAFDPSKHNLVTTDVLRQVAEKEGEAIALMADIQDEHRELFGTRINARDLRKQAIAAGKSVEQVWLETFNVPAKRAEKQAAEKAAYEKKIADEAVTKWRSENANPNTTTPMPSRTPFSERMPSSGVAADGSKKQPWDRTTDDLASQRVNKALKNIPLQ